MKSHAPAVLLLLLAAFTPSLFAADKQDKKQDKKKAGAAPGPEDLVRQADEKTAAGDSAGALVLLQEAWALPAAPPELGLRLGLALEAARDLDGAIDAYKAAAARLTAPAARGESLGRRAVLEELRGMAAAGETAKAAAAADPEGAWPAVALSRQSSREGKADEARAQAEKAVKQGGGSAAQGALGRAEEAAGRWAEAEAAYKAADLKDPLVATGLARVLRRTGRAAEAAPVIEAVTAAYPGAVEAFKESARVKVALGRGTEAFADASMAAALAENDPDAQRALQEAAVAKALGFVAENQAALAVQDLTKLRDEQPEAALVRVGLGRALAAARQSDAAVTELTKAATLDPTLAEAHYHLGFVQQTLRRDSAAAVAAYEKAVAADPARVEYRASLGAALVEAKQFDRAVAELGKVTADPTYTKGDAWVHLGAAHLGAKRYKDAVVALEKASVLAPGNPQVEAYLAWCYFGLKDAARFKAHGGKARTLGHKEPTLLAYLTRIEAGEPIK